MSISCTTTGAAGDETVANGNFADKLSYMQKLVAQKGIKTVAENNPAVLHKMTADPCVLVYNDTVYMYGTNDSQQAEVNQGLKPNGYEKINTLNVFCSKDLVNWTDCGEIPVAGRMNPKGAAKWAANSWAPAICTKKINGKDKFFLYFADSANGIGVLSADSPLGPFVDPIGKALVSRATPGTKGVHWMFDPAVLVDDDGKGYLYFGGGVADDIPHPKSARVVELGDDMISLAGTPVEIDPPFLFEDSGINKINGKYYYSYCANWADRKDFGNGPEVPPVAVIAYMVSDSPMGPFTYAGWALKNPGNYFGAWGNNHHWLFEFNNQLYMAYHAQIVEKTLGFTQGGFRNLVLNEFAISEDGTWPVQNMTKEGVKQVGKFNPYEKIPAATMHSSRNVAVTSSQTLYPVDKNAFTLIKGVDFSKGASAVNVQVAEGHGNGTVTFRLDNAFNGDVLAEVSVSNGTSFDSAVNLPATTENHNLYVILSGDVELKEFSFKAM